MTYQEFNHIYYKFTNEGSGIRPVDRISTSGYELKEFVEFALKTRLQEEDSQLRFGAVNF